MTDIAGEAQIVVEDLVKRFGHFVAVDHVSFSVGRGEIMGFLGPNGAGKSTVIRILCGLLRASAGRALVGGIDVAHAPEGARELTVAESVTFFGGIYRVPAKDFPSRMRFAIEMAGLSGRENALVATLAGG